MAVSKQAQLAADEAEANAAVAEMLSDPRLIAEFGMSLQRETTTRHKYKRCLEEFAEYLAAWYVTPGLLRAQRSDVARFIEWLGGDLDAAPPIFPGRPSLGQQDPRKSLSASTRKGYLSALRSFYYFCLDEHHLQYDPTAGLRAPKVEHKRGMTLNAEELQRFIDAPGNERDRVQAYLLVFTAQRAGALRDLRWEDVNLDEREITFRGKGAKTNVLPIHNELLGALSRWKRVLWDDAEKNPLIASALYDDRTAFVLLTRRGLPITVQTLGKQTKWRAARCGLRLHTSRDVYHENKSEVHPHAFRRSWATLQRRHGVALEDIADVLAHVSVDTTRKHYAFPPSEAKRRAVKNFTLS
jgi:integrase